MSNDYDYKPTEIEDEIFLSEIPLGLLEQSIKTQFNDPGEYRKKDYVQSFITRYKFTVDNIDDVDNLDESDTDEIERLRIDFVKFMLDIMQSYLGIGLDVDNLDEDDTNEMIHLTYRFFIKNIKKNFVTFIGNYIEEHKKDLIIDLPKKKDVTTLNFKAEIDNEEDIAIISNLSEIIDGILEQDFSVDEFMELVQSNEVCLETEYVKDHLNDFTITGNFVPKYIAMVDDFFKNELESKIRNKILKKYPKRESKKKEKEVKKDE